MNKPLHRTVYRLKMLVDMIANNSTGLVAGARHHNAISAYWYTRPVNFGDLVTPLVLRHYGLTPILMPPRWATLSCTGSIIEHLPDSFRGTVLGSGLIDETSVKRLAYARIIGVRGALTRERLGVSDDVILGDPGLLAAYLFDRTPSKKFRLGLVPHLQDKSVPIIHEIVSRYPDQIRVIDVQQSTQAVFREIDQCEHILSSSLHGVITADSLGIPNAWIVLSDRILGGEFKYNDYYSALDASFTPFRPTGKESLQSLCDMTHEPPSTVPQVRSLLNDGFRRLAMEVTGKSDLADIGQRYEA